MFSAAHNARGLSAAGGGETPRRVVALLVAAVLLLLHTAGEALHHLAHLPPPDTAAPVLLTAATNLVPHAPAHDDCPLCALGTLVGVAAAFVAVVAAVTCLAARHPLPVGRPAAAWSRLPRGPTAPRAPPVAAAA